MWMLDLNTCARSMPLESSGAGEPWFEHPFDEHDAPSSALEGYQITTGFVSLTTLKHLAPGCDQWIMLYQNCAI